MNNSSATNIKAIVGLILAIVAEDAASIGNFAPKPEELGILPSYCAIRAERWGDDSDRREVRPWLLVYGQDWYHMHHLCAGLNYINRAYGNVDHRQRNLSLALDDLGYMQRNAKTPKVLAETYLALAETFLGLKRDADALSALNSAVSLAPESAKTHNKLADYYSGQQQKERAMAAVVEGLKQVPNSKSLLRRYAELGGKPPYPTPYAKPEPEPEQVDSTVETSDVPKAEEPVKQPASEPAVPPGGANRNNPWCRFCTDNP